MIAFLKLQYRLGRIDDAFLNRLLEIGKITEAEKAEVISK